MNKKVPEIRFEGFRRGWEAGNLGNIFTFKQGLQCNIEEQKLIQGKGFVRFIRIIDLTNTNELPRYIKDPGKIYHVNHDDLFMVRYGSPGLLGYGFEGVIANNLFTIKPLFNSNNLYLYFLLMNMSEQILSLSSSTTMGALSFSSLNQLKILYSLSIEEQTKIGSYFQNIDELITNHQKKYDKLKKIKKSMLEKMFPKDGESVPEIRFEGFSGDWEEKRLGRIYNFQYGQFNTNPSNGGCYPVYGANGIIGGFTEFNSENSIIIGHMGENAGSILWGEGKHFVTYNGTITKPKNNSIYPIFGYYLLLKMNIKELCDGSGQPFLSYETLNNLVVKYSHSLDEQTKIGEFFQKLDKLIKLNQSEIEKLQNVKKSLLEKMFV